MVFSHGRLFTACLMFSLTGLLSGCQTTQSDTQTTQASSNGLGQLVISEPLAPNFKKEVALARISEFLHSSEATPEQKAKAFYDRGLLYDSFGLPSLARLDFSRALRLDPSMANAYNFLGIHYTLLGQFNEAYESFDATIELSPKHEYVYLNRGISLYYGDKNKLALEDLNKFQQLDTSDPYRAIWRYLAAYKVDKVAARKQLEIDRASIASDVWARQIIDLYLMNISERQFISGLTDNIKSQAQLAERLCEAYFYLGIFVRHYEQPERALNYFKLALATNVFEFVEHRYARRELLETRLLLHKNNLLKSELAKKAKESDNS